MRNRFEGHRRRLGSVGLIGAILLTGAGLTVWKSDALRAADAAAASQPQPMESVTAATVRERSHHATTTSVGTVLAMRSVTLRNEVAGIVRDASLAPGRVVEAGQVLVALDVSVEEAELRAQEAQAALAQTTFGRLQRLREDGAASQEEADQARAERDVAVAQIERTRAIIARKTIRAPFRARIGISDVHPGQYLDAGTQLTTLQGVGDTTHVDFTVSQQVAAGLWEGQTVEVSAGDGTPSAATIVAVDARVDPVTRNAMVRARMVGGSSQAAPGASVRVLVPLGAASMAVVVPATALRKGPAGDHVFVLAPDDAGQTRAQVRPVHSGPMIDGDVVILSGLAAGEQVAALGSFKLYESALVAVADGVPAQGGAR